MSANDKQVGGDHYRSSLQHWDFVQFLGLSYMEAQVLRYVSRSRKKNGAQDLEKGIHFLEKMLNPELPFGDVSLDAYVKANGLDEDEAEVTRLILAYHADPSDKNLLWAALGRMQAMRARL